MSALKSSSNTSLISAMGRVIPRYPVSWPTGTGTLAGSLHGSENLPLCGQTEPY